MQKLTFLLNEDYIELIKLLKLMRITESGSHSKFLVEKGEVVVNNKTELRKRCKLRKGDIVEWNDFLIEIV